MALRAGWGPTPGIELALADAEQLPSTNLFIKMVNLILITNLLVILIMVNLISITMVRMAVRMVM